MTKSTKPKKRGPGRPAGVKNKKSITSNKETKRGPGRPTGIKSKTENVITDAQPKRKPGRPAGAKNKKKKEELVRGPGRPKGRKGRISGTVETKTVGVVKTEELSNKKRSPGRPPGALNKNKNTLPEGVTYLNTSVLVVDMDISPIKCVYYISASSNKKLKCGMLEQQ